MTGPKNLHRCSLAALQDKRAALVRQLPALTAILRGSVIERYKRCGNANCRCAQGPGHGPKLYLSVSVSGERPVMLYVPAGYHEQVSKYLANYRQSRQVLEEICEVNLELLRRREELG
jgi:hypothetical protein